MLSVKSEMRECIEHCSDCSNICLETLSVYCLEVGHNKKEHIRLMLDCVEICRMSADFMLRNSPHQEKICGICAEICRECAENCEQFKDDEKMRACAEACRRCSDSCQQMSPGGNSANHQSNGQKNSLKEAERKTQEYFANKKPKTEKSAGHDDNENIAEEIGVKD